MDTVEEDVSPATDQTSNVPDDIELHSVIIEMALHPSKDILAAGTVDGPVKIYSYSADPVKSNHKLMSFRYHKDSCRAVHFSRAGEFLFTGSADTTVNAIDLNAGTISRRLTVDNGAAIYSLRSIDDYLLASGDDDGRIVVWDFRKEISVMSFDSCEEYISSLGVSSDKRTLLSTSGEGRLTAINLRARKIESQSELFDHELLSLAIVESENRVVVSSSNGMLYVFKWGEWNTSSEQFSVHSGSVDSVLAIGENLLCAGCEDGMIRAIQIHPNKVYGVIGGHEDLPVESLCESHDHRFIASCSYDRIVKFYDLSATKKALDGSTIKKSKKNAKLGSRNFFTGLE